MAETTKIPKEAVLYIHKKGTAYKCKDCLFAKDSGTRCALYGPQVTISPTKGTCGLFIMKKTSFDIPFIGGYNKENTGYAENPDGFSCARCEEFLPDEYDCKKIDKDSPGDDPGSIQPGACCNRWEKLHADD